MNPKEWQSKKLESTHRFVSIPATKPTTGRPAGGFLFGWDKNVTQPEVLHASDLGIFLKLSLPVPTLLVFAYTPPNHNTTNHTAELFAKISAYSPSLPHVIVMGDFNARTGSADTNPLSRRQSMDPVLNTRGKNLLSLAAVEGLTICNGKPEGDPQGQFTFINAANGGRSVVDYALVSLLMKPLVASFNVLDWPHSDHFPILLSLYYAYAPTLGQLC